VIKQLIKKKNSPLVMGILNLTPDSFYDGGAYKNEFAVIKRIKTMLEEGADIIDLGAYSSRPNATHISKEEELKRLLPVLKLIVKEFPKALLSIDTFRSEVAKRSIAEGAHIINDISGGTMDIAMFKTVAQLKVPYILMHMQGNPQNMQINPHYFDVTEEVLRYFQKKLKQLNSLGINDVTLDVGFGFGKSLKQNYQLLRDLKVFKQLNQALLVGVSRKSMLYKALDITPDKALNATSVAHALALANGANILRVHDVKEAVEAVKIFNYYKGN
jgi:dihydropteroate synthase